MAGNYLGIIPARGGSKRIKRKNLALLAGKPLLVYTIEAALAARRLTRVMVSTEDPEIAAVAKQSQAEVPFLRPPELAQDYSTSLQVIKHVLDTLGREGAVFDGVALLQPTSPFRTGKHIDAAIERFEKTAADTVTSVCAAEEHPFYAWKLAEEGELTSFISLECQTMDRRDLPPVYFENGAIYVCARSALDQDCLYGQKVISYQMSRFDSVDIDTPLDLQWAEFLLYYGQREG
jgi:CMP-N,N'-diacetyllegionaminic acid synthase